LGHQVDTEHGLPMPGADEHADVLLEEAWRRPLEGGSAPVEGRPEIAVRALIVDDEAHAMLLEEGLEIGATPRGSAVLGVLLEQASRAA